MEIAGAGKAFQSADPYGILVILWSFLLGFMKGNKSGEPDGLIKNQSLIPAAFPISLFHPSSPWFLAITPQF